MGREAPIGGKVTSRVRMRKRLLVDPCCRRHTHQRHRDKGIPAEVDLKRARDRVIVVRGMIEAVDAVVAEDIGVAVERLPRCRSGIVGLDSDLVPAGRYVERDLAFAGQPLSYGSGRYT